MLRRPLASSVLHLPASGSGTPFLPGNDNVRTRKVLPHQFPRHQDRNNARTPHDASPRRRIAFAVCMERFSSIRTMRVSSVDSKARSACMNPSTSQALNAFLGRYPPKAASRPAAYPSENLRLTLQHGLRMLNPAPAVDILLGAPPTSRLDSRHRYLWVIDEQGIPYIIEKCLDALDTTLPKHTNLTGGGAASMGGELWFASDCSLYISGGSGRYPPANKKQLDAAVEVFESLEYVVTSLGWDEATGFARRYREGEPGHD